MTGQSSVLARPDTQETPTVTLEELRHSLTSLPVVKPERPAVHAQHPYSTGQLPVINAEGIAAAEESSIQQHETLYVLDLLISRLEEQSVASLKSGYINLGIGIVVAAVAVAPLLLAVNDASVLSLSAAALTQSLVPKILVALLLLGVGGFFLRMYRGGLRQNRAYQNEMTSIECLKAAMVIDASDFANSRVIEYLLESPHIESVKPQEPVGNDTKPLSTIVAALTHKSAAA
jgi:hypothetical protein